MSTSRNLIIVVIVVILVAVGVSLFRNGGEEADIETAATATASADKAESVGESDTATPATTTTEAVPAARSRENNKAAGARTVKPSANSPDIMFVDWNFVPATPVKGEPVIIRASIKNNGAKPAPGFNVAWHASAEQSTPIHVWAVPTLNPGSRHMLEFEYAGFPREYAELKTMMVIDPEGVVVDKDRTNNEWVRTITVAK